MNEAELHRIATWTEIGLAAVTFVALLFIAAPYGRHARGGWGPGVPQRLGWILMELPAVALWATIFFFGDHATDVAPLVLLAVWQLHYVHRTFVFPFRIPRSDKTTPISVVGLAVVFNTLNAYVNARWVSHFGQYPAEWLRSWPFFVGLVLFLGGMAVNVGSDSTLLKLRATSAPGVYSTPHGGLFRWVSCPNYLGEIVEWTGWAILTWSISGAAFALYTAANLVPRAITHHRWYHTKVEGYPAERRAVFPYVL